MPKHIIRGSHLHIQQLEKELADLKERYESNTQNYKDLEVQYNNLLPQHTKCKQELADLKEERSKLLDACKEYRGQLDKLLGLVERLVKVEHDEHCNHSDEIMDLVAFIKKVRGGSDDTQQNILLSNM